jgi:hypothetical protein
MKLMNQTILNAQVAVKLKPDLKFRIQQYDFPSTSTPLRYGEFDWTEIWRGNRAYGLKAVCASDGSLILAYVSSGKTYPTATFASNSFHTTQAELDEVVSVDSGIHIFRIASPSPSTDLNASIDCKMAGHSDHFATTAYTGDVTYVPTVGDLDYSLRTAEGYNTFYTESLPDYELVANDSGEVILFILGATDRIYYKVSTDNGVTWGATTYLSWAYNYGEYWQNYATDIKQYGTYSYGTGLSPNRVTAAYNDKSELLLTSAVSQWGVTYPISFKIRGANGVWKDTGVSSYQYWNMINLSPRNAINATRTNCPFGDLYSYFDITESVGAVIGGCGVASQSAGAPIYLTSMDSVWDEDWLIMCDFYQTNETFAYGNVSTKQSPFALIVFDDHPEEQLWTYHNDPSCTYPYGVKGRVSMANASATLTSLQDFSSKVGDETHFNVTSIQNMPPSLISRLKTIAPTGQFVAKSNSTVDIGNGNPYSNLCSINGNVYLSTNDGSKLLFIKKKFDTEISAVIFTDASSFESTRPLAMTSNSTYVFGYNSNEIFISPLPADWVKPSVGTGAGAYLDLAFERVVSVKEDVREGQTSVLEILFNNYDGYFDTPTGSPINIKRGSRVSMYRGYFTTVSNTIENSRYFVDSWDWTREPNMSLFRVKCVDAWGLLEQYIFPRPVRFNIYEDEKTVYELVEMLVNTIGGTLTVQSKSSYVNTIYLKVDVSPGENAANLMRRLLLKVPDVIRFFGNDATMIYPLSTDASLYSYKFPS